MKERPMLIMIISILFIITGLYYTVSAIIATFFLLPGWLIILGPPGIAIGILLLLTGIFLWKGKIWAKEVVILLASLGVLSVIFELTRFNVPTNDGGMGGQFSIWLVTIPLVSIFLIWYLWLSKESKEFFN